MQDAKSILSRVTATYAGLDSYRDTGFVRLDFTTSSRKWTQTARFKTAYVSPAEFRWELESRNDAPDDGKMIAWQSGDEVQSWWSLNSALVSNPESLAAALDGFAGVSFDASTLVPGLIIDGMKLGGDITKLSNAHLIEDDTIDGHDCYRVEGKRVPHSGPTTVWVDKDSFVIRRVHEFDELANRTRASKTWFFEPSINVDVDDKLLDYAKPKTSPRVGGVREGG